MVGRFTSENVESIIILTVSIKEKNSDQSEKAIMQDDDEFTKSLDILTRRSSSLESSGLDELISFYGARSVVELDYQIDRFLRRSYEYLKETIDLFDDIISNKNIAIAVIAGVLPSDLLPSDLFELTPKEKDKLNKRNSLLENNDFYQKILLKLIDKSWPIEPTNPGELMIQGTVLLKFYDTALNARDITQNDILPIIFRVEEISRGICTCMNLWIGDNGRATAKDITALKKGATRKVTKIEKDWAELIPLIIEMDKEKAFDSAENFETVATEIFFEVKTRRKNRTIAHQWSQKTIRTCLNQVFGLTPKSFTQPLKLAITNLT